MPHISYLLVLVNRGDKTFAKLVLISLNLTVDNGSLSIGQFQVHMLNNLFSLKKNLCNMRHKESGGRGGGTVISEHLKLF